MHILYTFYLKRTNVSIHIYKDTPETILPTIFNPIFKKWQKTRQHTDFMVLAHTIRRDAGLY